MREDIAYFADVVERLNQEYDDYPDNAVDYYPHAMISNGEITLFRLKYCFGCTYIDVLGDRIWSDAEDEREFNEDTKEYEDLFEYCNKQFIKRIDYLHGFIETIRSNNE